MIDGFISKRRRLTLGADPEIFIFSGNQLIPAYMFLPPKGEGVKQYWDGFQAEWKYDHDGAHCQNNLVKYTRENLISLDQKAKKFDANARLSLVTVVRVPQVVLDNADPRHVELGCQPSYNAYRLKGEPVYDPRKLKYRFAGGHMHFGTWLRKPDYLKIVKTLDSILGVWAVGVARHIDNPVRRQYYGLAGEYRKPYYKGKEDIFGLLEGEGYGVEYRSLSNWWLASPAVMQLTWDIGRLCVRLASSKYGNLWAGNEQETIETINHCAANQADRIMKRNEPMFRWMLGQVYKSPKAIEQAIKVSQQGLECLVPEIENFKKNWHFDEQWVADAKQNWARFETSI